MQVKSLKIINFRNYLSERISFSEGLNVLIGQNASGKTNLLEAIYLAAIGKSPRSVQDKDMIQWDRDYLYLEIEVAKKYRTHRIEFYIDKQNKRIAIDKIPVLRVGELMGALNVIYFSPDEMKMIKDSPSERRRFIDISLSQQKKVYYYLLVRYNRILEQRNKLLKSKYDKDALEDMLSVYDIQLSETGAEIITHRIKFIEKLSLHAEKEHLKLTNCKERLELRYEGECVSKDIEELKARLYKRYINDREKDYNLKFTNSGPHRDDIKIMTDGIDVRKYGSQGQQRTATLSLKLAEISNFLEETGEKPVLLLDDVLSELDLQRQIQLINSTRDIQTVLTCTEYGLNTEIKPQIFSIDKGKIRKNQ